MYCTIRVLILTQVVFDAQNNHRRKSSLVATEKPSQYITRTKNTECYVHALLEKQRRAAGAGTGASLEGISEAISSPSLESSVNGIDGTTERKNDGARRVSEGQLDEQSWQDNLSAKLQESGSSMDDLQKNRDEDEVQNAVHSRLLTKKQLSDMAWGVRELSKRLGSIKMKLKVKTVFILTKAHDETLIENTREVVRWLLSPDRDVRYTVYVEDNLKDNKKFDSKGILFELEKLYSQNSGLNVDPKQDRRLKYWTNEMCRSRPHTFDFVVSLGGDGTVLYASWLFQRIVPPVLSFALGSLGFLTKFDYEKFPETLTKAFRDGVTISLRLRFEGTIMRSQSKKNLITEGGVDGDVEEENYAIRDLVEELVGEEKDDERTHKPDGTYEILNDIVVDRGPNPSKSINKTFQQ